ncbi:MAG: TlpA family protein disulfide reductase [Methylomicrobium sp.]|nr:TlpA family protein disulfide reductase [Methylomicrobium sp.]
MLVAVPARADNRPLQPFVDGSYQQILAAHEGRPLVLVIWSLTCSSCLKEMRSLNAWRQSTPDLEMILLSTDDISEQDEVLQMLRKHELDGLENWIFADENAQKLRFQIDPRWYGELPRMYFFNAKHERSGVSGVLSEQQYRERIADL